MDKPYFIHMAGQIGKQITYGLATLAMPTKRPKTFGIRASRTGKGLFAQFGVERLAMRPFKLWLVVKCIDMAHTAWAENLDNGASAGFMVGRARNKRVIGRFVSRQVEFTAQQRC
jgi:hypothetical protein